MIVILLRKWAKSRPPLSYYMHFADASCKEEDPVNPLLGNAKRDASTADLKSYQRWCGDSNSVTGVVEGRRSATAWARLIAIGATIPISAK